MVERKIINIYAYDMKPTICVSYLTEFDEFKEINLAKNVKIWARKDMLENFDLVFSLEKFIRNIQKIKIEKDIYREYQKLFAKEKWLNYLVETETFRTKKMALVKKPYRDFELVTKEFVETQLEKIILKKEEKKDEI